MVVIRVASAGNPQPLPTDVTNYWRRGTRAGHVAGPRTCLTSPLIVRHFRELRDPDVGASIRNERDLFDRLIGDGRDAPSPFDSADKAAVPVAVPSRLCPIGLERP